MNWIKTFFEDNSGGASMMRLSCFLWILILCFNITYINLKAKEMKPIDASYVTMTLGLMAVKAAQRVGEKAEEPPTTPVL